MTALRLVRIPSVEEKRQFLRNKDIKNNPSIFYNPRQKNFIEIFDVPLCYWFKESIFELLKSDSLKNYTNIVVGLQTSDDLRFLRAIWEISPNNHLIKRWILYQKGGSYGKWDGKQFNAVDWEYHGARIKAFGKGVIRNEGFYFLHGLWYSRIANHNLGSKLLPINAIIGMNGPGIFLKENIINDTIYSIAGFLNSRFATFMVRSISQSLVFQVDQVLRVPYCIDKNQKIGDLAKICFDYKRRLIAHEILELEFDIKEFLSKSYISNEITISPNLHLFEGVIDRILFGSISMPMQDVDEIISETGIPAGWFPLIKQYDNLPPSQKGLQEIPNDVIKLFDNLERKICSKEELNTIKKRLRLYFEKGWGIIEESDEHSTISSDGDEGPSVVGAYIPIPAETFLEELSQKMEIHPISIYWLLKEGIEKEGWRCIPEERRYTEDRFTVMILCLLGHRWPKQIEAGEPVPEWADTDGIIPITAGTGQPSLLDRVRERIAAEFPGGNVHEIEREFEEIMGITLERWHSSEFFKHHISQFKKRPIAWQLASIPSGGRGRGSRAQPAFSCLVYYHKCDRDVLHKIRTQYVGDLISRYETELRTLEGRQELSGEQATRKVQLENWLTELREFGQKLDVVSRTGFFSELLKEVATKEPLDKWTSRDGKAPHPTTKEEFLLQEQRYDPDINDGVRVNIAPLQKAGLLTVDVIAKKDLEKVISDRAEWRADERRWCREGKLPKPGWW